MPSIFVTLGQPLKRRFWQRASGFLQLFHPLPPIAAVAIMLLLATNGQIRELYVSYLEEPNASQIIFSLVGFSLLSFALYVTHNFLNVVREEVIYRNYIRVRPGFNLKTVRPLLGLLCAALPWFGVLWGLWGASDYLEEVSELSGVDPQIQTAIPQYYVLPAVVLVLIFAVAVLRLLFRFRRNRWLLAAHLFGIGGLLVLAALIPHTYSVAVYRFLGPFATLSIEILFVFAIASLLAWLAQEADFPLGPLLVMLGAVAALNVFSFEHFTKILVFIFAAAFVLAFLSRLWIIMSLALVLLFLAGATWHRSTMLESKSEALAALSPGSDPLSAATHAILHDRFVSWLNNRIDEKSGVNYPVFIVAVEGGGIYAAAAASVFLAKVQELNPSFATHLFAISGVSGGAVGATIFQALVNKSALSVSTSSSDPILATLCAAASPSTVATGISTLDETKQIMTADYFSPVIGAIWPDFLGEAMGRAEMLECSFLDTVNQYDQVAFSRLEQIYPDHWSEAGVDDTALVLNTTSAETGYRVAFAPFGLQTSIDSSLYSFSDKSFAAQFTDKSSQSLSGLENIGLIRAAVASARFPFILPPYELTFGSSKGERRLNFVDGAYSDNSGAGTALAIYREIASISPDDNSRPDIKLILLTSDDPEPDLTTAAGTYFGDTVAPIQTLFNVRDGLANQAVARVYDYFCQRNDVDQKCQNKNGKDPNNWHLMRLKLHDAAYELPLGWKISKTTMEVATWPLVGTPMLQQDCPSQTASAPTNDKRFPTPSSFANDARENGCVLTAIGQALGAN